MAERPLASEEALLFLKLGIETPCLKLEKKTLFGSYMR